MAILSLNDFFNKLPQGTYTFGLSDSVQTSRTRAGLTYRASAATRIWLGTINMPGGRHADARELEALLHRVQRVGNYFNFTPLEKQRTVRPKLWKAGDNLSGVFTSGTQAAGFTLRLGGLPPSYALTTGDYLSFNLGGVFRLYMVDVPTTANTSGVANVTLNIPLTHGALPPANTPVQLISPQVTCAYVDGSYSGLTYNPAISEPSSFSFHQVFRT